MQPEAFCARLAREARHLRRGAWGVALTALDGKRAGVPYWADLAARAVKRSRKTIYHWVEAAEIAEAFVPAIGKTRAYRLTISAWLAVRPYVGRAEPGELVDMLNAFLDEGCSIEQLEAQLREAFGPAEEPSILAALDTLMARSVQAAERLPEDSETRRDVERGVEWLRQARLSAEREGLK